MYDNHGYVPQQVYEPEVPYATVQKVRDSRGQYPEPEPESVMNIVDDEAIVPEFYPAEDTPRSRVSSNMEETRIETEVENEYTPRESQSGDEFRIETSVLNWSSGNTN